MSNEVLTDQVLCPQMMMFLFTAVCFYLQQCFRKLYNTTNGHKLAELLKGLVGRTSECLLSLSRKDPLFM